MLGLIIFALVSAFIVGLLARWALPGPDPMPVWLTVVIGFCGTLIGTGIVIAIEGRHTKDTTLIWIAGLLSSVALVIIYRRFVQKRPLWGRGVYRFPERGFGIQQYRERLRKVGIDPDQIGTGQPVVVPPPGAAMPRPGSSAHDHPGEPTENPAYYLGLLEELHDTGVLEDSEYDGARTRLLEKLR